MIHIKLIAIVLILQFVPISIAFWIGYRKYRDIIRCISSALFSWFFAVLILLLISKTLEHVITSPFIDTWKVIEDWIIFISQFVLTIVISAEWNRLFWGC